MVQNKGSKGSKKGSLSQGQLQKLTPVENEIYLMLTDDFLTPLQIALRRGTSVSAVHKVIRKIKKKGYSQKKVHRVQNNETTCEPHAKTIRLHAQHFSVRILFRRPSYDDIRSRSNVIYRDDCVVKLHKDSLEVIALSGMSFFGETADKATAKSMAFWTRVFTRLEHELGVSLIKHRSQNIKVVSHHYANINSGIAERAIDAGDKVRVYSREDGKLWFTIDSSFNFNEAETVHPETAQTDMSDVVEPLLNKLKSDNVILDRLENTLALLAQRNLETATAVDAIAQSLKPAELKEDKVEMKKMWYHG